MTAYDDLMAFQRQTEALAQVSGRLGWDQEVMMPEGAAAQRAEEMAALETVLHARRSDPRIGEWLDDCVTMDETGHANLRLVRRQHERAIRVPARLAAELARVTSLAQGIWARARADEDVAAFLPVLGDVVRLRREEGAALAQGGDPYDALLHDYEPGTTSDDLAAMFARLRPRLVALREKALAAPPAPRLTGSFPEAGQLALAHEVARAFGYDFERGRLDKSVHPFTAGSGDDVRITTRTDEADPFNCLYSTIHEVGHALYEQGIDGAHLLTPVGQGASMGVHESQSRICENQIGRSRAFTGWIYGRMRDIFGDFGIASENDFFRAVNRVARGHIRTEADEVQYNLHILLRFDLEQALMRGDLATGDLEAAWNDRFLADFGLAVDRPSHGMLQDVHWSAGLFGYFPTYSLGNVYAGCLHAALCRDLPALDADLARGDPGAAIRWLHAKVHRYGSLHDPLATITRAIGGEPGEGPLLDYLEAKFG
ncbi:MAG: carboxypeptidase M32 [Rubellimicrobium sp.]|nr:carboxypeptidase M32 [Rubellimicrobium sp.]